MAVVNRNRAEEVALGMTMLGLLFSSMLYGIALTQLYTYYRRFPRDPLNVKILVVATAVLDTASVVLVCHACWFKHLKQALSGNKQFPEVISLAELAISMLISGIAEIFMAYRVWMLSGRRVILTMVLLFLAILHLVSGEISAAEALQHSKFVPFQSVKVPSILRLSSAAVCDTGIAIALCYFLQQKRTGYKRTDEIIDHLMLFSINSGLLTSVASIACLITYLIIPKTWVYLALCFLISRLYSNTFLCALNSRQILQSGSDNDMDTPVLPRFSSTRRKGLFSRSPSEKATQGSGPRQIDVFVVTETVTTSDILTHGSGKNLRVHESADIKRLDSPTTASDSISSGSTISIQEVPRVLRR